jgi:hypothetical protein
MLPDKPLRHQCALRKLCLLLSRQGDSAAMTSSFLCGAACSILGTYPMAMLSALLFRFPIPFGGYSSGVHAVLPSLLAVTVYGLMFGGFIVQGLLGGVAGFLARRQGGLDQRRTWRLCAIYGVAASLPGVVALAVLDKIIGPW